MFPSSPSPHPLLAACLRVAALSLVCLIFQGCQGKSAPTAPQNMSPYMKKCLQSGVPLPPLWGDSNWVQKENLPAGEVFDADEAKYPQTEVWVYLSDKPKGICYALPRKKDATTIGLLGMICQGESGSACFWDNKQPGTDTLITPTAGLDPATEADGSNLKEKCVDCHRGDNAFLITPGTALQQEFPDQTVSPDEQDGRPTSMITPPYKPISTWPTPRPGWINEVNHAPAPGAQAAPAPASTPAPPVSTTTRAASANLSGACTSCHAIPKLTAGYCSLAAKMVNKHLMPPSGSTASPKIVADIASLKQTCNGLEKGVWP